MIHKDGIRCVINLSAALSNQVTTLKKAFWDSMPDVDEYDVQCKVIRNSNGLSARTLTNAKVSAYVYGFQLVFLRCQVLFRE